MVLRIDGNEDVIIMIKVKYDVFQLVTQVCSEKKNQKFSEYEHVRQTESIFYQRLHSRVSMHSLGMTMRAVFKPLTLLSSRRE